MNSVTYDFKWNRTL